MANPSGSWASRSPVLRTLGAQGIALILVFPLARITWFSAWPGWVWVVVQGGAAAMLARQMGLTGLWVPLQVLLPTALAWQAGARVPGWLYPSLLVSWILVFGGGMLTRVPLYNSNRGAWQVVADLLPPGSGVRFIDLGAGLGGLLGFLARGREDAHFVGVEASPAVWLVAWLRCLRLRNCRVSLGSLWRQNLSGYQVVHAFLSPAPMARLWAKACREMAPGALFLSHSFEIPGVMPERRIPLSGRKGACLLLYRIPIFKGCPDPTEN